jgi:GNAT superfamily N-acetyltransferase
MAGGYLIDDRGEVAMLWGIWVDPLARRGGLGRELVAGVSAWARDAGAARLRLAVTDCEASKPAAALYGGLGFADTGDREPLEWNATLITRVLDRPL